MKNCDIFTRTKKLDEILIWNFGWKEVSIGIHCTTTWSFCDFYLQIWENRFFWSTRKYVHKIFADKYAYQKSLIKTNFVQQKIRFCKKAALTRHMGSQWRANSYREASFALTLVRLENISSFCLEIWRLSEEYLHLIHILGVTDKLIL